MEFINATWEQRNLGISTHEFIIQADDPIDEIMPRLESSAKSCSYQVVKIPTGNFAFLQLLHDRGFVFIETVFQLRHRLRISDDRTILNRHAEMLSVQRLERTRHEMVFERVSQEIFNTDRISLDPIFGPAVAARRYANWLNDEVERGAGIFELRLHDDSIGFFVFRRDDTGVGVSALSGLFATKQHPGMGAALLRRLLIHARDEGCRLIETHVSTNNPAALKTHFSNDFEVVRPYYVLIRHNSH